MNTIYIPQKEKHFTLEDWMIRSVINAKITQWNELQEIDERKSLGAMDASLGRMNYPSQTDFEAFLNLLSDENLNDIIMLAAIGETLDVNTDLNTREERFLDFYQRHQEMIQDDRFDMIYLIMKKKYLPAAIRIGQMLLELPKGTDISDFPSELFNWNEGDTHDILCLLARTLKKRPQ